MENILTYKHNDHISVIGNRESRGRKAPKP